MKRAACSAAVAAVLLAACAATGEQETAEQAEGEKAPAVAERPAPPPKVATAPPTVAVAPPTVVTPPPQPEPPRVSDTEALISDFARVRRLPAAEVARELENARQTFNQSRSDPARVRLAMLMSLPGSGQEDARALEMLDPLVKTPAASLHALAVLIASYIQENRRLAVQTQGLQQNVQGLQANVQALQQKLDALKTLERSLTHRDAAPAAPRKTK